MNRCLIFSLAFFMTLSTLAIPLRTMQIRPGRWRLSRFGRANDETPESASAPLLYVQTQNPAWYARQPAKLRDELERRKAQLGGYRQAIEDARNLKTMAGGINLEEGDIGITPEAGIDILQERVDETESELDAYTKKTLVLRQQSLHRR